MNKVREGDLEKLGLLFERYKRMLFTYFYGMNKNAELSEDLVQNVFVRVLKYRSSFRGDGSFKYWIFHIARNVNADHYRNSGNIRHLDVEDHRDRIEGGSPADEDIVRREERQFLKRALMQLGHDEREIIILSKIEEMRYSEIAAMMEITEGAVKVRVFRAMQELKKMAQRAKNEFEVARSK